MEVILWILAAVLGLLVLFAWLQLYRIKDLLQELVAIERARDNYIVANQAERGLSIL